MKKGIVKSVGRHGLSCAGLGKIARQKHHRKQEKYLRNNADVLTVWLPSLAG